MGTLAGVPLHTPLPRYSETNVWSKRDVEYIHDTNEEKWQQFRKEYAHLEQYISKATFLKWKPKWLRMSKWLTCKCPQCHEIKDMATKYAEFSEQWHLNDALAGTFKNEAPDDAPPGVEPHCWTCYRHNPLYAGGQHPLKNFSDASALLYQMSVCDHAGDMDSKMTPDCAHG